ncbi:MAG: BCD family MFS transporter [Telmatospirillum sp.]|nr:BCD family MFS transporter [Telmatospirillum sp.]
MSAPAPARGRFWTRIGLRFLPFADAATTGLPMPRLLRLSLFQITVGMAIALTIGTLNRVMIVELDVSTALVSIMVALPLLAAPFRTLVGFKSDTHRSVLGWRRVPYIWFGTLLQFGGMAIMPFALLVLSGDNGAPVLAGQIAAALAFLLIGAGMQMTQTAGLALATDLAPEAVRPRVVALMYAMLLVGVVVSGFGFGVLLTDFSPMRLIQVIQGAAAVTMVANVVALWKQEPRDPARTKGRDPSVPDFWTSWHLFNAQPDTRRFLVALGLGTVAFAMQDTLLEPYGGEILHLGVAQTTLLTALMAGGALLSFALSARTLMRGCNPCRLAAHGLLLGLPAFLAVLFAAPLESALLFRAGATLIGFSVGLFSVGTLTAAMALDCHAGNGLALGAWGAVQATGAGLAIGSAGIIRDLVSPLALHGRLGDALAGPATGYGAVYQTEILLLLASLVAIGPLARHSSRNRLSRTDELGLIHLPS